MNSVPVKIMVCTTLALFAFAANSVLCRLALGGNSIDAASFTVIRLLAAIAVLMPMLALSNAYTHSPTKRNAKATSRGSGWAALMLFTYAVTFSFAYVSLATGMGALILFACVQITMIAASLLAGDKLHGTEWLGLMVAGAGFIYLLMPGLQAPPLVPALLMAVAGISWAVYTLLGRHSSQPLSDTGYNFLRTLPLLLLLAAVFFRDARLSAEGVLLAVLSGGLASAVGYTLWYIALGGLSAIQAAVLQLLVPVIAAIGGLLLLGEVIEQRLLLSSLLILGGILAVVLGRHLKPLYLRGH